MCRCNQGSRYHIHMKDWWQINPISQNLYVYCGNPKQLKIRQQSFRPTEHHLYWHFSARVLDALYFIILATSFPFSSTSFTACSFQSVSEKIRGSVSTSRIAATEEVITTRLTDELDSSLESYGSTKYSMQHAHAWGRSPRSQQFLLQRGQSILQPCW